MEGKGLRHLSRCVHFVAEPQPYPIKLKSDIYGSFVTSPPSRRSFRQLASERDFAGRPNDRDLLFLIFMPMRRQQRNQKEMLANSSNGQTVLTSGGIIGTIMAVNDDTLILRVKPDNLKIQVSRSAVTNIVNPDEPAKNKLSQTTNAFLR